MLSIHVRFGYNHIYSSKKQRKNRLFKEMIRDMAQKIKGKCNFCGKEYTHSYMNKHLPTCKERQRPMETGTGMKQCGYYELAVCFAYNKNYWLFIEIKETATLRDLDNCTYLRGMRTKACSGTLYDMLLRGWIWFSVRGLQRDTQLR